MGYAGKTNALAGQRLLVVGGSSGMGLSTAQLADQLGAYVIIAAHNPEKLRQALSQLSEKAQQREVDVTKEESLRQLADQLEPLDHLFITAGPGTRSRFLDDPVETARQYLEGKFWSAYLLIRLLAPKLRTDGSVTLVSGGLSLKPEKGSLMVTVAQHAIEGLAKGLAAELAPLRVNVIRPGAVDSSMWDYLPAEERSEFLEAAAAKTWVGRVGTPEDVAHAAVALMTNSYINGSVLNLDGGSFLR